jgi:Tol biopolymer transport system component
MQLIVKLVSVGALCGMVPNKALSQTNPFCRMTRDCVSTAGVLGNNQSITPELSHDGRWLLFTSSASNLVPNDTNGTSDLFLRDRVAGTTARVNVRSDGAQVSGAVFNPKITPDGRFVTYCTQATVVLPDSNGRIDVFVLDRNTGLVTRESDSFLGSGSNGHSTSTGISADGRYVLFNSDAFNIVPGDVDSTTDVFLRDRQAGTTTCISTAGGFPVGGAAAGVSDDGRFCVFSSAAATLVPNDTNLRVDIFLYDRVMQQVTRVSVDSQGQQADDDSRGPLMAPDGNSILFQSRAGNLVAGDVNGTWDMFRRDLTSGVVTRLLIGTTGIEPALGSDPSLSGDGRFLGLVSANPNLVPNDINGRQDVFVVDVVTFAVTLRSPAILGGGGNADCYNRCTVAADAAVVVFESDASNLVASDTNSLKEIFTHDAQPPPLVYCTAKTNSLGCVPSISWSGALHVGSASAFSVTANNVLNNKSALFAYSIVGRAAIPFQGGTLCVQPPLVRIPVSNSGGSPAPVADCSGTLSIDFAAVVASGIYPSLTVGQGVWAMFWSRDPGFLEPDNTNLTDGLEFALLP